MSRFNCLVTFKIRYNLFLLQDIIDIPFPYLKLLCYCKEIASFDDEDTVRLIVAHLQQYYNVYKNVTFEDVKKRFNDR